MTLRQVGITVGHEIFDYGDDEIRLIVRVANDDETLVAIFPPEDANALKVNTETPAQVSEQLFSTQYVGRAFSIEIVAIEEDDTSWIGPIMATAQATSLLTGGAGTVAAALAPTALGVLGVKNQPIGWFRGRWTGLDDWGIGRYIAVGNGDLLLWFDVEIGGQVGTEIVGRTAVPTPTTVTAPPTSAAVAVQQPTRTPVPTKTPAPIPTPTSTPMPTATKAALAVATPTQIPTVVQLAWLNADGEVVTEAQSGTIVTLFAQLDGVPDSIIEVGIFEVDPNSADDLVVTGRLTVSNGIGRADWEAVWMEDGWLGLGGDPEYKFVVLNVDSPELIVR